MGPPAGRADGRGFTCGLRYAARSTRITNSRRTLGPPAGADRLPWALFLSTGRAVAIFHHPRPTRRDNANRHHFMTRRLCVPRRPANRRGSIARPRRPRRPPSRPGRRPRSDPRPSACADLGTLAGAGAGARLGCARNRKHALTQQGSLKCPHPHVGVSRQNICSAVLTGDGHPTTRVSPTLSRARRVVVGATTRRAGRDPRSNSRPAAGSSAEATSSGASARRSLHPRRC